MRTPNVGLHLKGCISIPAKYPELVLNAHYQIRVSCHCDGRNSRDEEQSLRSTLSSFVKNTDELTKRAAEGDSTPSECSYKVSCRL